MSVTKAVILHSVEDVEYCSKNDLLAGRYVLTTNMGVDTYLKETLGISAFCLDRFLSIEELKAFREEARKNVNSLLRDLDFEISPAINQILNLEIRYFEPLYSYYGKLTYVAIKALLVAIRRAATELRVQSFEICDSNDQWLLMGADIAFRNLMQGEFQQIDWLPAHLGNNQYRRTWENRVKHNLKMCLNKVKHLKERHRRGRLSIFLTEPAYDVTQFESVFRKFRVTRYGLAGWPLQNQSKIDSLRSFLLDLQKKNRNNAGPDVILDSLGSELKCMFLYDFIQNAPDELDRVLTLQRLHQTNSFCLGVWGNSPMAGQRALLFEFLRSSKIMVVGVQHGSNYGDTVFPWHWETDYSRCTHFFSYGFGSEDLVPLLPEGVQMPTIWPVGRKFTRQRQRSSKKQSIDILLPLTNNSSLLKGGLDRFPPTSLTQNQISILEYCEKQLHLSSYAKPPSASTFDNCSVLTLLQKAKHLKYVKGQTLTRFLDDWHPRAVIIEYPSTPLYDVIRLDTEIFMLLDPLNGFHAKAQEMLAKRIHLFTTVASLLESVSLFFQGSISAKRDTSFSEYYVRDLVPKAEIESYLSDALNLTKFQTKAGG